jgi:NAD(P)-dependent dehydrogenase (short-subunit alcohol dehydrogenase family)
MVAIITGASGGIGAYIAATLAETQDHIVLAYNHNLDAVEQLKNTLKCSASVIRVDVSQECDVFRMVGDTIEKYGQVDILVNNAGISINGMSWKLDRDDWQEVIDTNLTGPFLCIKYVLPYMREKKYGRIINISSVVGQMGIVGTVAYAASKAGLEGLTRTVATEVAKKNITVNAISLGYFDTGLIASLPIEDKISIINKIPIGRLGTSLELGNTVSFLINASYITGQVINVNGGYLM